MKRTASHDRARAKDDGRNGRRRRRRRRLGRSRRRCRLLPLKGARAAPLSHTHNSNLLVRPSFPLSHTPSSTQNKPFSRFQGRESTPSPSPTTPLDLFPPRMTSTEEILGVGGGFGESQRCCLVAVRACARPVRGARRPKSQPPSAFLSLLLSCAPCSLSCAARGAVKQGSTLLAATHCRRPRAQGSTAAARRVAVTVKRAPAKERGPSSLAIKTQEGAKNPLRARARETAPRRALQATPGAALARGGRQWPRRGETDGRARCAMRRPAARMRRRRHPTETRAVRSPPLPPLKKNTHRTAPPPPTNKQKQTRSPPQRRRRPRTTATAARPTSTCTSACSSATARRA